MNRRALPYRAVAVLLVVTLLGQTFTPVRTSSAQTQSATARVAAPQAAPCYPLHLPMILQPAGLAAAQSNPAEQAPDAVDLVTPDFTIISPGEGWTISGMTYFAIQPVEPDSVASVTFRAGETVLGADNTPGDGFQIFLDANALPKGTLALTALATGPCGQSSQTITVKVAPTPPTNVTLGATGGVVASEVGSIITVPPGGVAEGTTISVTEKSQAQVTADHGIDWESMSVTFLGAQDVQANGSISKPVAVASVGFGNRVQPGQAVVNYRIMPDGDGDGVDELVVVNSASVAPNNTVISDPI
ncbi:MAG TPA: hypothetical protein PKE45_08605 [Caldilineaceae bacterium]|nr:hypothetical protein [Caldilineaceae bacterium]